MRSVFVKIAIASFMALVLLAQDVSGLQIKNLIESSASGASHNPMISIRERKQLDIEKNGNLLPGDDLADGIDFKHYRMMKKTMLEKKLERLYKSNDSIGYLVEKFDLTDQYGNALRLDQTREGDG